MLKLMMLLMLLTWAHVFSFHFTNPIITMCLFPCEAYDSRKGGQTHHPKKKWKEKTMSTNQQFLAKQPRATQ